MGIEENVQRFVTAGFFALVTAGAIDGCDAYKWTKQYDANGPVERVQVEVFDAQAYHRWNLSYVCVLAKTQNSNYVSACTRSLPVKLAQDAELALKKEIFDQDHDPVTLIGSYASKDRFKLTSLIVDKETINFKWGAFQ